MQPAPLLKRLFIIGPTASGKSDLAAELAYRLGSRVISADARQCYKYLDIGTAKPEAELLAKVPHHYISALSPGGFDQPRLSESAADFRRRCDAWEARFQTIIQQKNDDSAPPIIYAGGSTLYLQAVLFDLDDAPPANKEHLKQLQAEADTRGLEEIYRRLRDVDPEYAARIDGLNRHRIFRALDVYMQTGRPFSSFHKRSDFEQPRPGSEVFMLNWPREMLHERINRRVDAMIEAGLVNEVRDLLEWLPEDAQALQTVGYREVIAHLKGELSHEQMIADIKTHTRRYAKRQLTWFRRWPFVKQLKPAEQSFETMLNSLMRAS
ncbi:MAG: tRNA (adenosine(37)-N6)-dimethylallyltransferase MiaA [Cyclonatronaceae bacterium]